MHDVHGLGLGAAAQNTTLVNVRFDIAVFELEKQEEQCSVLLFGCQLLQTNILGSIRILNFSRIGKSELNTCTIDFKKSCITDSKISANNLLFDRK